MTLNAAGLPSTAAFIGFVGGAFQTRFTIPTPGARNGKNP